MMRRLILFVCGVISVFAVAFPTGSVQAWSLFPSECAANDKNCVTVCKGEAAKSPTCVEAKKQTADKNPVAKLIGQAANLVALIAGAVAVVMIIIAGFQLVTSGGSAETVTKARSRITGALIGLIIIALAWTIIRLVTDMVIA